ncbi:MAG: bifunctional phosphoglucose/phosphomannose isomerase [candidate division WOR-3 bacterium]
MRLDANAGIQGSKVRAALDGYRQMLTLVLGLPEQIEQARAIADRVDYGSVRRFDNVVVAGMGGSAIGGSVLRGLLGSELTLPIIVCRDYVVPAIVTRRSLFFAVSYSGNTEETLSAFEQARRIRCRVIAVTSGGRLAELAQRAGVPVVLLSAGLPPRAALGYLFVPLLVGLEQLRICRSYRQDLVEAVGLIRKNRRLWLNRARVLARVLDSRLPVVYSTSRLLDAVAERWQCQLNENAKVMCHVNALPEQNHNELVGIGAPRFLAQRTVLIALLDAATHTRTRLRLKHLLEMTRTGYYRAVQLESQGRSELARIFSLLMLGDMVSVELARRRHVNPMPVARIDELKRRMDWAGRKR